MLGLKLDHFSKGGHRPPWITLREDGIHLDEYVNYELGNKIITLFYDQCNFHLREGNMN